MTFQDLTSFLDSLGEKYIPARELIVCKEHEVIYHHLSGFSDVEQTKPLNGEEIYLIYSSTKVATCVGALRLVERGMLSLQDKVSKYLPEYGQLTVRDGDVLRPAKTELLIEHLFTMCGGFSYNRQSEWLLPLKNDRNATTRDAIRALAKEPLLFDPGTHFEYSLCHDILGAVIEVVSGKTLDQYMQDEIFVPLGMTDTGFHLTEEQKKRLSAHYVYDSDKSALVTADNIFTNFHLTPNYESGGAGIYSTATDYAKFVDAIACGGTAYNGYQVLSSEMVQLLSENRLNETQMSDFHRRFGHYGNGYGLGVMVLLDRKPRNYQCVEGVFGWGGAGGTKVVIDTKNQLSFYYAQEVEGGGYAWKYEEHPHNAIANMLYQILEIR